MSKGNKEKEGNGDLISGLPYSLLRYAIVLFSAEVFREIKDGL